MYRKIRRLLTRRVHKKTPLPSKHYQTHKETARAVILERLVIISAECGIPYGKVAIRNQKRRWGSCSSLGNLNFNYKLSLLPTCLMDYVIVHELCHLRQLNHGPKFWALVALHYPTYREVELQLRELERATRVQPGAISSYVQTHRCSLCGDTSSVV